ncbi:conserved hypothetical protein [Echinococcus multilocularis]|uniref:Uncharacterized protein n=1 Tax=Echinococcus multilocularis TaxID=6211 RepID=A0A068YFB8_ECHMU|nr:conserved hypothetical protein [Echinococcus multilocularis]
MTENRGFWIREPFMEYSNPELLQLASYLAQHDVTFSNLPQYPTEDSEDGDKESIEAVKPMIRHESHRAVSNRPPLRTCSPPVRDKNLNYPQRKPLHAPTERQLNASKLRQLINKSKAALLDLDSDILAERAAVNLHMPPTGNKMSVRYRLPRGAVASSGVLKPCVRLLGEKGARKGKRSVLGRRVDETASTYHKAFRHPGRCRTHDTDLLSSYLKRLSLAELPRVDTVPGFRSQKYSRYQQKFPPELVAFLEKWGATLGVHGSNAIKGIRISPSRSCFLDSLSETSSASTDSIEKFIRNYAKQQSPYQNRTLGTREVEQNRHDSPKTCHFEYSPRAQCIPKVKTPLTEEPSITSTYQTLRLPVEQYRRLLADSRTTEAAHEERWRRGGLASNTIFLSRLCDWLAEEIVDSCIETGTNLIDSFSNDIIDELFRHELVTSPCSPWDSFSGLAGSPQLQQTSILQRLLPHAPSEAPIELNQHKASSGKCFAHQDSTERKILTLKHGSCSTTESERPPHTQPSAEDCVATQETRKSVLQPLVYQPQNALSPIEEVSASSFLPSKVEQNRSENRKNGNGQSFEVSFSLHAVEGTLESMCVDERPYNYVMENGCVRRSSVDAISSLDQDTCNAGVIAENITMYCSTGNPLHESVKLTTLEDVRFQTTGPAICPPQSLHAEIIDSAPSSAKTSIPVECETPPDTSTRGSPIETSLNSRKRLELSEGLRMKSSSVYGDVHYKNSLSGTEVLTPIMANKEVSCRENRKRSNVVPEPESSLKEFPKSNEPQSIQDNCSVTLPITSEGLSSPKPIKLHKKPPSIDLVSSLTYTSIPDISTPDVPISTNSETFQEKTLSLSNVTPSMIEASDGYADDFESTGEANQAEKSVN